MKLTGIADEAGETVDAQIDATNALGWKHIEARFVKVDGFEKEASTKFQKKLSK